MSNTLSTTTTTVSPLMNVLNSYLDTIQTSSGAKPDPATKQNFIATCVAFELNPIKRQAYLLGYDQNIKDGNNWIKKPNFTFVIAVGGFTAIAARTGEYAGKDQARYTYRSNELESATVTVYRLVKNQRCPFSATAFFDESCQKTKDGKPNKMWSERPKGMLEKVAFAMALRAAFPESLSGLYTDDEISQQKEEPIIESIEPELLAHLKRGILSLVELTGLDEPTITSQILEQFNAQNLESLTKIQGKHALKWLANTVNTAQAKQKELENSIQDIELEDIPNIEN